MARNSRTHPTRITVLICAVAAFQGLFIGAPIANADVLGDVTGQVEELASPVEQVASPVQQAGEMVPPPIQGVARAVAPPAKAPDAAPPPSAGEPGTLAGQAMTTVTGAASAAGEAIRSTDSTVDAGKEDAEAAATGTALPPAVPSTSIDPASSPAPAPAPAATGPADSSAAPTEDLPVSPRTTFVPPPGNDGSTGAPLPRWVAYVWPAVALAGPKLAHLAEGWEQATMHLLAGTAGGSGDAQGVAGVHASGGRAGDRGSSPLFSSIPSDVGHAFASVPTSAFVYLGLLALAVIAVGLAVRREIAVGRRQ